MSYYQNSYSAGDTFIDFKGNKYTVVTGGNTPSTPFDSSNIVNDKIVWGSIELEPLEEGGGTGQGLVDYEANTSYSVGDIVMYDDKIYRCITAHTSTSTFDNAKWTEISAGGSSSSGGISIWQANTAYNVNDVVIDSNLIWQCATAHTSSTTFDEFKWICISGGEISNGLETITLFSGSYGVNNESDNTFNSTLQLSDSLSSCDFIYIKASDGTNKVNFTGIVYLSDVPINKQFRVSFYSTNEWRASVSVVIVDSTHMAIAWLDKGSSVSNLVINTVVGIRKAKPIVSSGMKYETLWEGEAGDYSGSFNITISTSEPITKYKKLGLNICVSNGDGNYYRELDVNVIIDIINASSGAYTMNNGYSNNDDYINILSSSSISQLAISGNKSKITKIIGISEGVVVPTGVQAARVTLWEGSYSTSNQSSTNLSNNVQLNDSIENYDQIEVTINGSYYNKTIGIIDVEDVVYGEANTQLTCLANSTAYGNMCVGFYDSTHFAICWKDTYYWSDSAITKIVGIKYIQPDSYSTEEKLIGTWIDGKPLYRKVFENVSNNFDTGLNSSLYSIIKVYGYNVGGDGAISQIPNSSTDLWITMAGILGHTVNGDINYVIVEYIKN